MKNENAENKTLWELVEEIKDPRSASGKRYKLGNILRLMLSGFLCGCNSTAAVIRWGKRISKKHKEALGFSRRLPSEGTLSNLFGKMDVSAMEEVLNGKKLKQAKESSTLLQIAIDGKTIKGSAYNESPAVHLLSAFAVGLKSTLKQYEQENGDNEITSALKLLKDMPLEGVVVSGDAIFAQKKICQLIKEQGGDYFFVIKNNKKTRREDIAHHFCQKQKDPIEEVELGHGRVERRRFWVLKTPWNLYHWPECKNLCKIERTRYDKCRNKESIEISYAITSLEGDQAQAENLKQIWRDHWKIENQLHWVKDMEFEEDRSIVRSKNGPRFFSSLRNQAVEILSKRKKRLKYEREDLAHFPKRSIKVLQEN